MVCARCSDYKAELQYDGNRPNRVCQECFIFLTGHTVLEDREGKFKGILEVSSALLCLPSGLLCPLSIVTHPGLQPGCPSLALHPQQEGWESLPQQSEGCVHLPPSCSKPWDQAAELPSPQDVSSTIIARTAPTCPCFAGFSGVGREFPRELSQLTALSTICTGYSGICWLFWQKGAAEISSRSLLCSSLQLLDKNGKGGTRGWFVIPQDDPLVLYIYAAPQVRLSSDPPSGDILLCPGDISLCPGDIPLCPSPASHCCLSLAGRPSPHLHSPAGLPSAGHAPERVPAPLPAGAVPAGVHLHGRH